MGNSRGFVLAFVMTAVLALTILVTCLLGSTGLVRKLTNRFVDDVSGIYRAESALVGFFGGVPTGSLGLPEVNVDDDGLWGRACASAEPENRRAGVGNSAEVCAFFGSRYSRYRFDDWSEFVRDFRAALLERIRRRPGIRMLNGRQRFFRMDSSLSLEVVGGDVLFDFESAVTAVDLLVDGDVTVRGGARFDTLRVVARGNLQLEGRVSVGHLEAFSDGVVTVRSEARIRGLVHGREAVFLEDRARCEFPCVAVSLGTGDSRCEQRGRARVEGVLAAPGGAVAADYGNLAGAAYPGSVTDSSRAILPAAFGGRRLVFARTAQ